MVLHVARMAGVRRVVSCPAGKSDPYVKGALGTSRFTTRVVASTTDPEWFEEFVAPIYSWSVPNLLVLRVQDRGLFSSKSLGSVSRSPTPSLTRQDRVFFWDHALLP